MNNGRISFRPVTIIARGWERRASRAARLAFAFMLIMCLSMIFSTAIVQASVVLFTAAVALELAGSGGRQFRRTPLDVPFAAFMIARFLTIATSVDPLRSLSAIPHEFFYYGVFFLVTQTLKRENPDEHLLVLAAVVVAGVVAALYGVTMALSGAEERATSTTAGSYTLGGYLCALFPLVLLPLYGRRGGMSGFLTVVAAVIVALGILLTFDRLHWAGLALSVLLVGVVFRRRLLLVSLVAGVIVVVSVPLMHERFGQLVALSQHMSGRDVLWRGAMMLLDKHPLFGFGPRTFEQIFPLFEAMPVRGVGSWHNDYLQVYMESGVVGLSAMLWLVVSVYRQAWRFLRGQPSIPDRHLVLALLFSLTVVFLVGGALDTLVGILFRVLLAMFAVITAQVGEMKSVDVNES